MKRQLRSVIPLLFVVGACGGEPVGAEGADPAAEVAQSLHGSSPVRFNFVKTADWGTGYNARVDITNLGPDVIQGWGVGFDMPVNVSVNVALPPEAWSIFNTIGVENDVRVSGSNPIGVGQTHSFFLFGEYQGAFGFPTRCRAVHLGTPVPCNGSTDLTVPSSPSNVRIFGTGSNLVDLVWDPASDDVGVTGYLLEFQTRGAPALEIGEVPATLPVTRARITGLSGGTQYAFSISARDAAGNVSPVASSPITTTVPGSPSSTRPIATPQPPCLGVMCPSRTHCEVLPSAIPTCAPN